jgi:O-antigen/teichoic acid export membrane protein
MSVALLGSILGGGLGFLFLVVMARLLEQTDFGLLVLGMSLLGTTVAISVGGTDYAMIRYVASASSAGEKRGAMIAALQVAMAANLVLALCAFALAVPISEHLLNQPRFSDELRIFAIAIPFSVLGQMLSAGLSGLEHARGELARKVVEQSGRIAFASFAVTAGFGVVGAAFGVAVAAAAAAATVGFLLLLALPRGGATIRVGVRKVIGFSWPQAVANVATQSWVLVNILILVNTTNARTVALFGAAFAIAQLPLLVYNAFSYRFSPVISRLWARGEHDALSATLKSVTRWVAILAIPFYAVAIALPGSLLQIYGPSYEDAAFALAIMAVATLVNSLAGPVERVLIMTGRVKIEMATNVAATIATVAAALVLTPRYGLVGAAFSMLLYAVLRNAVKSYFVRKLMGMSALSRALLGPLAAGAGASLPIALLASLTPLGDSLAGTALLGGSLIALYAFALVRLIGISAVDRDTLNLSLRTGKQARATASAGAEPPP